MKIVLSANTHWNIYNFRLDLVKSLIKKNDIYVVGRKDRSSQKLKKIGCKVIPLNIDLHSTSLFGEFILFCKFFFIIKRINPNIYLGFTIKPNLYGSVICNFLKIRNICNITGLGKSFMYRGFLKIFIIFLYKLSIKKSSLVFFQNKDDLNYFKRNNIVQKNNYKLIPGSGIKNLNRQKIKKNSKKKYFTFLYVGRILKEKGIKELVCAFENISHLKRKIKLVLVGEISKEMKLFAKRYFKKNIIHKKFTSNVKKYYENCECFVIPSYREGLSKSLLEACSYGLPIIASNVPGCKELVKNSYNGFLFKPRNSKQIEKAIGKILNLKNKTLNIMGKRSRGIIKYKYNVSNIIKIYLKEIENVAK